MTPIFAPPPKPEERAQEYLGTRERVGSLDQQIRNTERRLRQHERKYGASFERDRSGAGQRLYQRDMQQLQGLQREMGRASRDLGGFSAQTRRSASRLSRGPQQKSPGLLGGIAQGIFGRGTPPRQGPPPRRSGLFG